MKTETEVRKIKANILSWVDKTDGYISICFNEQLKLLNEILGD